MIFLVLSGKMIFDFPKNMILLFTRKMKEDLYPKNTWKSDIFCKCSGKMAFLVLTEKMIYLFPKNMINRRNQLDAIN